MRLLDRFRRVPFGSSGAVVAFWLLLGGIAIVHGAVNHCTVAAEGEALRIYNLAIRQLPPYLVWAMITPVVFWLARRFPLITPRWRPAAALHLGAALACVALAGAARAFFHDAIIHGLAKGHAWQEWRGGSRLGTYELDLFIYCALLATASGVETYRQARARLRHEDELRNQLTRARLEALQRQMQPHFLFNTLNTVSALVERDPAAARRVVARLSEMLRKVLSVSDEQQTTLREELEFVRSYLEIEQVRFGNRLTVCVDAPAHLLNVCVPALVLQPLVENAIHHAIAVSRAPGRVELRVLERDAQVIMQVRDSGCAPETPSRSSNGAGVALRNTRLRLEALYGSAASVSLERDASGCRSEIRIPMSPADRSAALA